MLRAAYFASRSDQASPFRELPSATPVALLILCGLLAAYGPHVRPGTDVIRNAVSPDGKMGAVLVVRDAGAVTDDAAMVSLNVDNWFARHLAVFWPAAVFTVSEHARWEADGKQ